MNVEAEVPDTPEELKHKDLVKKSVNFASPENEADNSEQINLMVINSYNETDFSKLGNFAKLDGIK